MFTYEEDIGMYTIKVADDPRTRNRVVTYRPPKNIISQLELISLWEKKTGRSFKRIHVPEEEIVKLSESMYLQLSALDHTIHHRLCYFDHAYMHLHIGRQIQQTQFLMVPM